MLITNKLYRKFRAKTGSRSFVKTNEKGEKTVVVTSNNPEFCRLLVENLGFTEEFVKVEKI